MQGTFTHIINDVKYKKGYRKVFLNMKKNPLKGPPLLVPPSASFPTEGASTTGTKRLGN